MKANLYENSRCQLNTTEKTTYLEQSPGHHFAVKKQSTPAAQETSFPTFPNLTSRLMKTKLYGFKGREAQFKLLAIPYNPLGYRLRKGFLTAIWFAMFEFSVKIKLLRQYRWIDQTKPSIKLNWMVSLILILLRSFSISVNSGSRIINFANNSASIHLVFKE